MSDCNEWISVEKALPPRPGLYEVTNDRVFISADSISKYYYDHNGFTHGFGYLKPTFWREICSNDKQIKMIKTDLNREFLDTLLKIYTDEIVIASNAIYELKRVYNTSRVPDALNRLLDIIQTLDARIRRLEK